MSELSAGQFSSQVASSDLAHILDALRLDHAVHYGESYGTEVLLRLARSDADRIDGLILDAPVDADADYWTSLEDRRGAFIDLMMGVSQWCMADDRCHRDFAVQSPLDVLDALRWRVREDPLRVALRTRSAGTGLVIGIAELDTAIGNQLVSADGRGRALSALAAAADGDMSVLSHLVLESRGIDVGTLQPSKEAESLGRYYATRCADLASRGRRTAMDYVSQLRLGDGAFGTVLFSDVPCLGWPRGEAPASRALADVATLGVRTVVLASDADPATPLTWARSVHMSLQKGSYVVTRGGGHVSFGRSPCATATVQRFLTEDVDTAANEESCTVEFVRYP